MPQTVGAPLCPPDPNLAATSQRSAREQALAAAIKATPSIHSLLDKHATQRPDAIAFACASVEGLWVRASWARFAEDTRRIQAGFHDLGIGPGDHVAVLLDNRAAYACFAAYIGLLRRGGVLVPLNTRSTVEELAHALVAADCRWLIAASDLAATVEAARTQAPNLRGVVGVGGVPNGWADWRHIAGHRAQADAEVTVAPDMVSSILFTSGTTSRPKGVVHTHASAIATGGIFASGLELGLEDVLHHAVPFFTSSGAQFTFMAALWAGCTMVIEPAFDAPRMVQRMVEEGTTVACGVPAHFVFMLETLRARRAELGRVRLWNYGGAPMPTEMVRTLSGTFPWTKQKQNYGMTETGPTGTMLMHEFTHSKAGSVGLPMPLCETVVVDEAGRSVPVGKIGEICIRSPGLMQGYYRNSEATAAALVEGWVRTGDIGRKDADGFLYYLDRLKDVINRGGLKISSMEVEDALFRHAAVLEAAVVAMPHPQLGEDLRAFVALRPGMAASIGDLRRHCAERLAGHKVPRDIRLVPALPRNSMGKVQKTVLRGVA